MLSALIPSRLSYSAVLLAEQPIHQGSVQHGPLVLVSDPRKFPTPTTDRDRTVSRRSEPSSRATLMGEQPNPWDLLPLCSSFLPGRLVCLSVKHPCAITLCGRLPIGLRVPLEASVTLLEATTPVKLPTKQCPRSCELAFKHSKVRISTAAPRRLASPLLSLRTILHIECPNAMLSCSKGSRGLFVPLRVIGIFTDTTISPNSRLRQCPDHYTIRAGRNLPDKEFRYLRTVIVTASSLNFAQPCVFVKQLPGPILCAPSYWGPFFPKLQGQFA